MTERQQFEQEALAGAQREIDAARVEVRNSGLDLGSLEILRTGTGGHYESELRLFVFRDAQICDALEVAVWQDGRAVVTAKELGEWFRAELRSLG